MKRFWMVGLAATVIVAGACSSSDDDTVSATPEVVVLDSAESAAAAETSTDGTDGGAADGDDGETETGGETDEGAATAAPANGDEEQALAFAQCMRDNGVDMADPTVNADGSIDLFGGQGPGGADGLSDTEQAAFEACGDVLEGASFLPGGGDLTEIEDQLLKIAQCFRDQGLDVDDPDLANFAPGNGAGTPFGPDFDPTSPEAQAAIEACGDLIAGFAPQGGQ